MANAAGSSSNSTIEKEGCDDDCQQINNVDEIRIWVDSIEAKRAGVISWQSEYSIFRVSQWLRKIKPEAYTPQSVSIGPLHYYEEHLRPMQAHKLHYLNCFLDRHKSKINLDDCVKALSELKEKARKCYSETTGRGFEKDEFVIMMVIDGCFILELFEIIKEEKRDYLYLNRSRFWEVLHDLINLENQLPLFVLRRLFHLVYPQHTSGYFHLTIYACLLSWFGLHGPSSYERIISSLPLPEHEAKHLLDLHRRVHVNSFKKKIKDGKQELLRTSCASKLKCAGVKFQNDKDKKKKEDKDKKKDEDEDKKEDEDEDKSPNTSLFDIDFNMDKGELTIPTLKVFDETEHTLRNLLAFEQGQQDIIPYFSAYAAFMDGLIDTHRDVELLEEKGIIENHLGNPEDVVTLFNNIVKHVAIRDPFFSGVIEDVKDYQEKRWHRWRESLMEKYFNTPWAIFSFLAALFLLIFTIIQTICSIVQVAWPNY